MLFVLIGLEVLVVRFQPHDLGAGRIAMAVVLLARAVSVGIPMRQFSLPRLVDREDIAVMLEGGLRGGVSVALALSLPPGETRDALSEITYAVVACSILVQSLTLNRVVCRMSRPFVASEPSGREQPCQSSTETRASRCIDRAGWQNGERVTPQPSPPDH